MPLSPGVRIGAYEVLAPLGKGGMGEVYRARDARLNRDVALKVLPDAVTHDPSRVERFAREAQVLASLNHPHIGAIYGIVESGSVDALVLELVEGPTLAELLATRRGGGLPLDEALPLARQIVDALEAAHDLGIVHRDLKPANIKVRPDGTVKVLDFGLAKALDPAMPSGDFSHATTITAPDWTHAGTILGTPGYMSPEQAAGRRIDRRTDIWAFGVVLMEMLTGRQVFGGESTSHVIAAVLREEPDFTRLPPGTPASIRRLLRRCLQKDPKLRLDSAASVRLELEDAASAPAEVETERVGASRRGALPLAAAALAGALLATTVWMLRPSATPPAAAITKLALTLPADGPFEPSLQAAARDFAVASDGSFIVYCTSGGRLAVRRFDQLETSILAGVEDAAMPFVSPDNQWIGFVQDNLSLKKIPAAGGPAITLTRLPVWPRGASWIDQDTIVIGTNSETTGLLRVPAGGGQPVVMTKPDGAHGEEGHVLPSGLPGGRAVLFTIGAADPGEAQIAVYDLDTGRRTTVLKGGRDAQFVASGHLLYQAGLGMSAVRFDLRQQRVVGEPVRILDNLAVAPTAALNVAVTGTGTLAYAVSPGTAARRSLVWIDRQGHETPVGAPERAYESARLSPDGANVVVGIRDQQNDLWMWSLARQTLSRLTFDGDVDLSPVWTPDGRRIIFSSARTGAYNLYAVDINRAGTDQRLTRSANTQLPDSVTADGASVIAHEVQPQTRSDIERFSLPTGPNGAPPRGEPLVHGPFDEWNGEVSPDGSLLAFQSGGAGTQEVYVSPYPDVSGARWQISSGGGQAPTWTRGGRELIYVDGSGRLTAVAIERSGGDVHAVTRTPIGTRSYASPVPWRSYDVSADGRRFLVIREDGTTHDASPIQFVVVQHWFDDLRRILPTS